jgi:hypothetical protein
MFELWSTKRDLLGAKVTKELSEAPSKMKNGKSFELAGHPYDFLKCGWT